MDGAFVGRDRELAELTAAVTAGTRRIWIGAAAGLGKTALLAQLAARCRERDLAYHWLAPHEPATPAALRAVADELLRAGGPGDRRRLLIIDDLAMLRAVESWFVERFLPALPAAVTVVIADRAIAPAWRAADGGGGGGALALAPLGDADARHYLALRGVADDRCAEIIAAADGIPAILAAAADAAGPPPPAGRAFITEAARFYIRHDSDDHRLAIAVLAAARTTPYELLELAFDDPHAARDAHAWLSRLSVVDHTPDGLRPDPLLRKAWERELADRAPGLWGRARAAVRAFADHRIAMARDPLRWLLDRLYVDRDAAALRDYAILPAAEPPLAVAALGAGDHAAVTALAAAHHGPRAAAAIARWIDDDRAAFDVLRDPRGELRGYLCSVAITAAAEPPEGDPAIDQCVAHLRALDWFGLATSPDARALVVRDWMVAGAHQAPSAGAAVVLAQIAARLLTTPAVELQFVVTERAALWQRLFRFLGLAPRVAGEHRWGDRQYTVLAVDWRDASVGHVLQTASDAVSAAIAAPVLAVGTARLPVAAPDHADRAADGSRELSAALERRLVQLSRSAALSPREQEVLQLLVLGRSYTDIGVALQITPRTARFHQRNVLEKIGAESRLDLVRLLL
ncbi:MAG TPA: LuxR C-terminal-related transcriptional regulator [Kofleriaceae bacterium]|nr:LuxR C-terminal-related transcriptional regulator [Kofleriaceae bacterium]